MIIKIQNYQAINNLEFELKSGINLISGNSNNGKSSVIRAMRDIFFNKVSSDKIKYNTKELKVSVDNIEMIRNSKGTYYLIDGEKLEKVGRSIVPEVKKAFNIDVIDINGVNVVPNFLFQMQKPFLFDKTAGQKNDVIIGTKNDKLLLCLDNIKKEKQSLKNEKKVLNEVVNTLKSENLERDSKIKKMEGVDKLVVIIKDFECKKDVLLKKIDLFKKIKEEISEKNDLMKKLDRKKEFDFSVLEKSTKLSDKKKDLNEKINLVKKINEMKKNEEEERIDKISSILSVLDINELNKRKEELDNATSKLLAFADAVKKRNSLFKEIEDTTTQLEVIREKINGLELEETTIKKDLKVCPICGGNL